MLKGAWGVGCGAGRDWQGHTQPRTSAPGKPRRGLSCGLWVVVGLLDAEEVVRSSAPILEFKGEVKDSFLALTGEDVLDTASGGGEENLRHRRGDLPSTKCSPLLFWLVAKNSSNDLKARAKAIKRLWPSEKLVS